MSKKPIAIDPELAAKYEHEGQFEAFDEVFKKVVRTPATAPEAKAENTPTLREPFEQEES